MLQVVVIGRIVVSTYHYPPRLDCVLIVPPQELVPFFFGTVDEPRQVPSRLHHLFSTDGLPSPQSVCHVLRYKDYFLFSTSLTIALSLRYRVSAFHQVVSHLTIYIPFLVRIVRVNAEQSFVSARETAGFRTNIVYPVRGMKGRNPLRQVWQARFGYFSFSDFPYRTLIIHLTFSNVNSLFEKFFGKLIAKIIRFHLLLTILACCLKVNRMALFFINIFS